MRNSSTARLSKLLATIAATGIILLIGGCKDNSPIGVPQQTSGRIMVVHTAPSGPDTVDFLVDDIVVSFGNRYADTLNRFNNTGYTNAISGTRSIAVRNAATLTNFFSLPVDVSSAVARSVFLLDSASQTGSITTLDSLSTPPAGKARVRFVHLSSNAPAVDVAFGSNVLFTNRAFKQSTSFVLVDTGVATVQFRLAGTATVAASKTYSSRSGDPNNLIFENRRIYTLYARGIVGSSGRLGLRVGRLANN